MRFGFRFITALAVALFATNTFAQDKGWFTASDINEGLYNISFPGGTAAEYFNQLGISAEGELNVIVDANVDLVELPPINVKHVNGIDVVMLPGKLAPYLLVNGSDNIAAAFGGPVEEVGAYTVVVSVDRIYMQQVQQTIDEDGSEFRFDLRFKGGTALDYVNAIRAAYADAKIVAMHGLEEFIVPAVNMNGVTVGAALEAIENQRAIIRGEHTEVSLHDADILGSRERVYTLSLKRHSHEIESAVWSVGKHIELGIGEADLLSAVRAVLDLNEQDAVVRFHPETRLLMVRGRHQTLKMVDETLEQVQRSAVSGAQSLRKQSDVDLIEELRARIATLERRLGLQDNE